MFETMRSRKSLILSILGATTIGLLALGYLVKAKKPERTASDGWRISTTSLLTKDLIDVAILDESRLWAINSNSIFH
jgi:hypothetical protein